LGVFFLRSDREQTGAVSADVLLTLRDHVWYFKRKRCQGTELETCVKREEGSCNRMKG
jgi:hypothetical protein